MAASNSDRHRPQYPSPLRTVTNSPVSAESLYEPTASIDSGSPMSSSADHSTCIDLSCPLTFPHGPGLYLHNGEPPPNVESLAWGASNPPPRIWEARKRLLAPGLYADEDMSAVMGFWNCHYIPWGDVSFGAIDEVMDTETEAKKSKEHGMDMEMEEQGLEERMGDMRIDDPATESENTPYWQEGNGIVNADASQYLGFYTTTADPAPSMEVRGGGTMLLDSDVESMRMLTEAMDISGREEEL
ncbi:MAG: hypothetical protein LQ352_003905 [Teloschistes flavicans]|nr:MAG: hypothetical protein LQ352_003905 [Teloschistes flavicans]